MKGAAGRPTYDAGPGGAWQSRQAREPEGATFETASMGGRRGGPPVFILGFLAILASVVAIGVGGQATPGATPVPPAAATSPSATPAESLPVMVFPVPTPGSSEAVVVGSFGGPVELTIRRQSEGIFVHGDVFVPSVTWVYVSLLDAVGQMAGWASVSVPGAAGPALEDGPSLRFDVDVTIPPRLSDRTLWIQAMAYDGSGKVIGSARVGVRPDGGPVDGPQGLDGFAPVRLDEPSRVSPGSTPVGAP